MVSEWQKKKSRTYLTDLINRQRWVLESGEDCGRGRA